MSNAIAVRCVVKTYEDTKPETITVESDSIWDDRVWVTVGSVRVCVIGRHIITAVENAMRASR